MAKFVPFIKIVPLCACGKTLVLVLNKFDELSGHGLVLAEVHTRFKTSSRS